MIGNDWIISLVKLCGIYSIFLPSKFAPISAQKDLELIGIGASLPGEVYEALAPAFESFRTTFVSLDNEYYSIGSGLGQEIFLNEIEDGFPRPITYIASDSVLTPEDYEKNPNLQMIPVLAG